LVVVPVVYAAVFGIGTDETEKGAEA